MRIKFILSVIIISMSLTTLTTGCNHNKIACPTYKDSFPDAKKKKATPGAQKPKVEKIRRASSGVMPGRDGRTKAPTRESRAKVNKGQDKTPKDYSSGKKL